MWPRDSISLAKAAHNKRTKDKPMTLTQQANALALTKAPGKAPYLSQRATNLMHTIMAFWAQRRTPMMFDRAMCSHEVAELREQRLVAVNWESCSVMPTTGTMAAAYRTEAA